MTNIVHKLKSLACAAFALALSTTSALADITVYTDKLTLPDGEVGKSYGYNWIYFDTIPSYNTFYGGVIPYTLSVKADSPNTLPPGMNFANTSSANAIYGTPTTAGDYDIDVVITDSSEPAQVAYATYHITIKEPVLEPVVGKTTLPPTTQWYQTEIDLAGSVTGGKTPYTYAVTEEVGNALPAGLYLSSGGVISGKPSVYGDNLSFKITVSDSSTTPLAINITYTLSIAQPAPLSASTNLGLAPVGKGKIYDLSKTVSGGVPPYTFEKTNGSYPPGYDLVDGVLSGTATVAGGPYLFTLKVTDDKGSFDGFEYSLETVEMAGFTDDDPEEPASGVQVNCRTADGVVRQRTCHQLTASDTTWSDSWYYVTGELSLSSVAVNGKVALVLDDDAVLTINGGESDHVAGIQVAPGNTLTIYAERSGTGQLIANGGYESAGIGGNDPGGSCGKVIIYGGVITATGGSFAAGIGGSDDHGNGGIVEIYGGTVTATSGSASAAGIGKGWGSSANNGLLKVGANVVVRADTTTPLGDSAIREPDANGFIDLTTVRRYYRIETTGPVPLTQTTSEFAFYTGDAVEFDLAAKVSGGTTPYTFSGDVPTGLTLNPNGTLTGSLSVADTYNFTLRVTDATSPDPMTLDARYTLVVSAPDPLSATSDLGAAKVGKAVNIPLSGTIAGGVPPYTFEVTTSETLPTGFNLMGGVLSGTPAAAGTLSFKITVTDSRDSTLPVTYTLEASESTAGMTDDDPDEPESGVTVSCLTPDGTFPRTCNQVASSASLVTWNNSWY